MPNYLVQVTIHQVISAQDGREAATRASGFAKSLEAESREVRYRLAPVEGAVPEHGTQEHQARFRMPDAS